MSNKIEFPAALAFMNFEPGQQVFKIEQINRLVEIEQHVAAARQRVEYTEQLFHQQFQENQQQAWQAGYQAGLSQALDEVADLLKACRSSENLIAELVISALKKIVHAIPNRKLMPELVLKAVRDLIADYSKLTVSVHPDLVASVKKSLDENLTESAYECLIEIKADPELGSDGCRITTGVGVINADLSYQLKALENTFTNSLQPMRHTDTQNA